MSSSAISNGRQVLVVEDESRARAMLAKALPAMNYTPTFAASAEAAIKAMEARSAGGDGFDILILDLNLPGQGGIDLLEQLRRGRRDLQVIILTGFGDLETARKAIRLDVVDFLTKPCALGDLEVALDRASKRRRGQLVDQAGALQPAETATPVFIAPAAEPARSAGDPQSMEAVERQQILLALQRHDGNRTAAAAELGISVRKLYYRLGEYQRKGLM